jgi:hypothetical protein
MKLAMFVPEAISESVGLVIPAGRLSVRVKAALTGVEETACCPDDGPEAGGTLIIAVVGRLLSLVIPVLSLFCRQNQTPAARAKAAKIQGNRFFRLRIARYLESSRTSGFSHRHRARGKLDLSPQPAILGGSDRSGGQPKLQSRAGTQACDYLYAWVNRPK